MTGNNSLNVKATGVIALAVMCSRVLGLIREIVFNALFGASSMGVFLIAFRAPNLLRDLFAEGALSISFVTIFSRKIELEGPDSAWKLASKMMTLVTVFMSLLTLLGIIFAKPLIGILAPGFAPADLQVTVFLTQVMYPFILLVSLAALVMGMLNSRNIFGIPALASSFFNIGSILGGILCGWWLDPHFGERSLTGLAIGTLIGGLLQLVVQLPSLKRVGFKFKPDFHWKDKDIRDILILTLPAVIAASAVQINVLINSSFASYIGKEAVTWLNSAFRLMQFPIGIFGVAVATITLPVVSRIAAGEDHQLFGWTLARAMRLAVFLTLPSAVGLWILAHPIISLIYQHGIFYANDAIQTAYALQFYALGLVAYSCIKVLSPGFYAINRKWTPMLISFACIALNIGLNFLFIFKLGMQQRGLAFSTSICASVNFLTLYILMARHYPLQTSHFLSMLWRCILACVAVAGVCLGALIYFPQFMQHPLLTVRAISLLLVIVCAALVYLLVCFVLKIETTQDIVTFIRRKLASNP